MLDVLGHLYFSWKLRFRNCKMFLLLIKIYLDSNPPTPGNKISFYPKVVVVQIFFHAILTSGYVTG